ncbi:TetR/AcrR family transcriptional regulator [Rhodococcus sp. ABRD24]|uniref:TetR/AcrR family transcriptional regulator n=1 Tax=Rhodococcus sp. ABRD24 TaxID=2507582 RepID=UPI00103BD923|nr:TetR family transcriptional regulator [Rhodococcus sp. ABRD24]QBJ98678.1 TetR/AcrR family transcriptional regulator [Rhodococcus sp. ABRD24]
MAVPGTQAQDLNTRARIRDAAIRVFGEQGFDAGVRAVATAAGVSPGLVNHHFGSKQGLRSACDEKVLSIIVSEKKAVLTASSPARMLTALAEIEQYAPLVAYLVRSFQAGGRLAASLFEHMVAGVETYLEAGVAEGRLRPSRDPAARARYLTLNSLGSTLLYLQMRNEQDGSAGYGAAIRAMTDEIMLPSLEVHTEGLFVDTSMLDAYVAHEPE